MIGSSENRISYNGNGIATEFAYNFIIIEKSDIKVLHVAADGTEQLLTKDYYVDMEKSVVLYPGYAPGAEIPEQDRPPVLPVGERLVIYREVPITQASALDKHWPFNVIEDGLDKLTIICQQIWDRLQRSFYVSESTSTNFDTKVPIEAGKTFRVKDDGTGFEVTEDPGKVIDGATALLEQTTEQANIAVESSVSAQNAANSVQKYKALWFDSVAAMKAEPSLTAGAYVNTAGYYTPNDGGGASYLIREKGETDIDDGGSIHELQNGLVAELIVENSTVNVKQFGAKGDGIADDTQAIQKAISTLFEVYIPNGSFIVSSPIEINKSVLVNGAGQKECIVKNTSTDGYLWNFANKTAYTMSVIKNMTMRGNNRTNNCATGKLWLVRFENTRLIDFNIVFGGLEDSSWNGGFKAKKSIIRNCNKVYVALSYAMNDVTFESCDITNIYQYVISSSITRLHITNLNFVNTAIEKCSGYLIGCDATADSDIRIFAYQLAFNGCYLEFVKCFAPYVQISGVYAFNGCHIYTTPFIDSSVNYYNADIMFNQCCLNCGTDGNYVISIGDNERVNVKIESGRFGFRNNTSFTSYKNVVNGKNLEIIYNHLPNKKTYGNNTVTVPSVVDANSTTDLNSDLQNKTFARLYGDLYYYNISANKWIKVQEAGKPFDVVATAGGTYEFALDAPSDKNKYLFIIHMPNGECSIGLLCAIMQANYRYTAIIQNQSFTISSNGATITLTNTASSELSAYGMLFRLY